MTITEAIDKLSERAAAETDMFAGKTVREYFIESFGSKSAMDLVDSFKADKHNEDWDGERQKPSPDLDKLMRSRRAVAFLASARGCAHRQYVETELSARIAGLSRCAWRRIGLARSKSFAGEPK